MKKRKLDTLLILRGLLAVSVVVWHIAESNDNIPVFIRIPGRTAVWIFFGISGYVISYGFLTKRYLLNRADIKAFYINRFLRIYPLFLLLSLLTLVTAYLITGKFVINFSDLPSQIFMLQFNHEYVLNGVFWTLGIEVQFYLIAPLLVTLFLNKFRYGFLLNTGIYFLLLLWLPFAFYFFGLSFDGRNIISNLSHFFIGMMACKLVLDNKHSKYNSYLLTGVIVSILLLTNYLYQYSIKFYWTLGTFLIDLVILLSVMLHANLEKEIIPQTGLILRTLTFLGIISYGVYAWHPFLIKYIPLLDNSILIVLITTVFAAFVSYKFVEQPILKMKRQNKKAILK